MPDFKKIQATARKIENTASVVAAHAGAGKKDGLKYEADAAWTKEKVERIAANAVALCELAGVDPMGLRVLPEEPIAAPLAKK